MQKLYYKKPEKIEFVAGTMSIVCTNILKKIAHKYTLDDILKQQMGLLMMAPSHTPWNVYLDV